MSSTRRSDRRLAAALALTLLAAPALALAETPREQAVRAAKQATVLYKSGQLAEAAELFLEAHRLTGLPVQLRNAAKALEESGATARAIETWTALLELPAASDEDRAEAREHLVRLAPPVVAPPPPPPAATARSDAPADPPASDGPLLVTAPLDAPERPAWPGYALIGAGGAAAVGGTILWIASSSSLSTLDDRLGSTTGGQITGIDAATAQSDLDGINQQRVIGSALIGIGALAAVTGILYALDAL